MRALLLITMAAVLSAAPALAQSETGADFARPYGVSPGAENRPYQGARGAGGNRVVINGVIQSGASVSAEAQARSRAFAGGVGHAFGGVGGGIFAQSNATAIGNQLNVVVDGRYNTVIVNSRQINNGDIRAEAGIGVVSGGTSVTETERDHD